MLVTEGLLGLIGTVVTTVIVTEINTLEPEVFADVVAQIRLTPRASPPRINAHTET